MLSQGTGAPLTKSIDILSNTRQPESEFFTLIIFVANATKFVFLSVFTVIKRSALQFGQNHCPRVQKVQLGWPCWFALFKKYKVQHLVMIIWCQCLFKKSMCHLVNYRMTHYVLVSFLVYRPIHNTWSLTRLLNPPTLRHLHKSLVHHYQLRIWMAEIAVHIST